MLKKEDIDFIQENFKYSLDRMKDLPNEIWGAYEIKQKKISDLLPTLKVLAPSTSPPLESPSASGASPDLFD